MPADPWRRRPRIALAAFGRATFDLAQARAVLSRSRAALESLPVDVVGVSDLLTEPAAVADYARGLDVDLLICQFTTFVDGRFAAAAAEAVGVPILLWALREAPNPGQRLALNSLTGANLAARTLRGRSRFFRFVLGDPEEAALGERVAQVARAAAVRRLLAGFRVLVLGSAPDGFFFSDPDPVRCGTLGVEVVRLDLAECFRRASALPAEAWRPVLDGVRARLTGLERIPPEQAERFARMEAVVEAEVAARGASAVAVRCWPEFFTEFGAAACAVVSALTERGVPASCEADVLGALTMTVLERLTDGPPYLGDLAALDARRRAAVFWHCGAGAFSLAAPPVGPAAGVQPNRGVGLALQFALRPGRVTLARIGETPGGMRLLVGGGEVLDAPQPFLGTAATVRLDGAGTIEDRVGRLIEDGWEPHYALAYGDVRRELSDLAALMGIPLVEM